MEGLPSQHVVALTLKTSKEPEPNFLQLPWALPLEEWPDELAVRLPRGRHRHVVRFIDHEGNFFACKELSSELAHREYRLLEHLKEIGLPVVRLVGVADERVTADGEPLDAILITRHLPYSLPYLHLFAGASPHGLQDGVINALVILLVRLHLAGFYWGDCSLGNALFRRDAGALVAYVVDTETSELHNQLSDGQRRHDLDIAVENIVGGLFELEAMGKLEPTVDPVEVVNDLQRRYDELWRELTATDLLGPEELWRIRERLQRLNDLGFDTTEIELVDSSEGSNRVRFRPRVVDEGHHRRQIKQLTGIETGENQARRLLGAISSFGAWASHVEGRELPEAVVAYRWLTERYEPTIAAVPAELRARLVDPEIYHQVLDHLWFLSEEAGHDVGLEEAVSSYVAEVLAKAPDERVVLETPFDVNES